VGAIPQILVGPGPETRSCQARGERSLRISRTPVPRSWKRTGKEEAKRRSATVSTDPAGPKMVTGAREVDRKGGATGAADGEAASLRSGAPAGPTRQPWWRTARRGQVVDRQGPPFLGVGEDLVGGGPRLLRRPGRERRDRRWAS
jgi:hypothetical protein